MLLGCQDFQALDRSVSTNALASVNANSVRIVGHSEEAPRIKNEKSACRPRLSDGPRAGNRTRGGEAQGAPSRFGNLKIPLIWFRSVDASDDGPCPIDAQLRRPLP